ncbi:MAG: aminotransferase DegT [Rhodospirillaceae bacterium]|nr:aminotransferase DegT [Rhodospirillaceae bacterium]
MRFVDLKAQYRRLEEEIGARMQQVLEHGQFIMGPEVPEFEAALAAFAGAKHAVGVANGTDALHIALMAEEIGPGDAVFLPSFTFTATAEVVLHCHATPVFCDVDPTTFNLDLEDLERKVDAVVAAGKLTPRAVIAVDLFGLPVDYAALAEIAARFDLFVLGDAAQSYGAECGDRKVGALAPVTATSFFPAKPLGCYGDGGALLTDDGSRADIFRSIRAHGKGTAKYDITRIGLNSRLDTLQAAVLIPKLGIFSDELEKRRRVAAMYTDRIDDIARTPLRDSNTLKSAWAQYSILVDRRDDIASRLKEHGVPTAIYYPKPMHLQPAYRHFGEGEGSLPISERLSDEVLCLPMHPYLDTETVDKICDLIRSSLQSD